MRHANRGVLAVTTPLLLPVILTGLIALASLLASSGSAAETFTVTNTDDSGTGSLRQAMTDANNTAGADTINFTVSGTITLVSTLPIVTDTAGLTIDGTGQNITISGNHAVRPLQMDAGAVLHLKNLTIAEGDGGVGSAGAIFASSGNLTLTGVTVTDSKAPTAAGIFVSTGGTLTISGSTITENIAENYAGGVYGLNSTVTITDSTISGNEAEFGGGGVYASGGTLTITNSTISGNMINPANGAGGGVSVTGETATATITNSTISNNSGGSGGGIYNRGDMTVDGVTVSGNSAFSAGGIDNATDGVLMLMNSTIHNNRQTSASGVGAGVANAATATIINSTMSENEAMNVGGGIYNSFGDLTLTNSRVLGNRAPTGAGINNGDMTVTITNSTISGNEATQRAAGIYSQGTIILTGSTVSDNTAGGYGAGICCFGTVTIENSTLSGNEVTSSDGDGGALWNSSGNVEIKSSTITNNSADSGGGLESEGANMSVENSIVAGNSTEDCDGAITDDGNNIGGDTSCDFSGDSTAPMLEALAYNGGPTDTHALMGGSPAINSGSGCPATDQRGAPRSSCDIGAFEFGATPPETTTPTATASGSITPTPTGGGSPTPTLSPTPTTGGGQTPTFPPTQTPTPTPVPSETAAPTPTATFAAGLRGDGTCDNLITLADVIAALSEFATVDPGAPCANRSNVDCDSDLDGEDALRIVAHIGGVPKTPPGGCGPIGEAA
jgi:hypothetical protein